MYAIYIPHLTEEIYQAFFINHEKELSIHQHQWRTNIEPNKEILYFGDIISFILTEIRKFKSEKGWSLKEPFKQLTIIAPKALLNEIKQTENDLYACTSAEIITIQDSISDAIQVLCIE
jgi:valyl-tRNA synthetase